MSDEQAQFVAAAAIEYVTDREWLTAMQYLLSFADDDRAAIALIREALDQAGQQPPTDGAATAVAAVMATADVEFVVTPSTGIDARRAQHIPFAVEHI